MKPTFTIDPAQLPALLAFARVAAHGNFRRAATELGISPSALSQTIRGLETRLGVRLLLRTTRRVTPTEAGDTLLARILPALGAIDSAVDDLRQQRERPAGLLRITVPQSIVSTLIEPHLPAFFDAYPDVQIDLRVDAAHNDLVGDGLDAGIRLGEKVQQDMIALPLGGPQRSAVVASPDYLRRRGEPQHPRDLAAHNCLRHRYASSGVVYRWEFCERGRWYEVGVQGSIVTNDIALTLRAAVAGVGLVYTVEPFVREAVSSGRLVSVLQEHLPPYDGYYLYFPGGAPLAPKVRVFADFLRARLHSESTE